MLAPAAHGSMLPITEITQIMLRRHKSIEQISLLLLLKLYQVLAVP